jgi:hypothetical protein
MALLGLPATALAQTTTGTGTTTTNVNANLSVNITTVGINDSTTTFSTASTDEKKAYIGAGDIAGDVDLTFTIQPSTWIGKSYQLQLSSESIDLTGTRTLGSSTLTVTSSISAIITAIDKNNTTTTTTTEDTDAADVVDSALATIQAGLGYAPADDAPAVGDTTDAGTLDTTDAAETTDATDSTDATDPTGATDEGDDTDPADATDTNGTTDTTETTETTATGDDRPLPSQSLCDATNPASNQTRPWSSLVEGAHTLQLSITARRQQLSTIGGSNQQEQTDEDSVTLYFDSTNPAAPSDIVLSRGDGRFILSWVAPSAEEATDLQYEVIAYPAADNCDANTVVVTTTQTTDVSIAGLTNAARYFVEVRTVDQAGNKGTFSAPLEGTPTPVIDYFEAYKAAGGKEAGGFCFIATAAYGDYNHPDVQTLRRFRDEVLAQSAPGRAFIGWYYAHGRQWAQTIEGQPTLRAVVRGALGIVARWAGFVTEHPVGGLWATLIALWVFGFTLTVATLDALRVRLRGEAGLPSKRRPTTTTTTPSAVSGTKKAIAALFTGAALFATALPAGEARAEGPRYVALELKFGPARYDDLDKEFGGSGPFTNYFGNGSNFIVEAELDYYVYQGFGALGIGASIGFLRFGGQSVIANNDGTTEASQQGTALWTLPANLSVVYRMDEFMKRYKVPLVPYVKLGPSYTLWWISNGDGGIAEVGADKALGGKYGMHVKGGLMLNLDWIDETSAAAFENSAGVNNTYLFFEYNWLWLNNFGQSTGLDLSNKYFSFGLAIEI